MCRKKDKLKRTIGMASMALLLFSYETACSWVVQSTNVLTTALWKQPAEYFRTVFNDCFLWQTFVQGYTCQIFVSSLRSCSHDSHTWPLDVPDDPVYPHTRYPSAVKHKHVEEKQDRQRTYNVRMRRVHETIVAVEKQCVLHISVRMGNNERVHACEWVGARARACASARVALIIQHATRRHTVICGLSGSTIFFDVVS